MAKNASKNMFDMLSELKDEEYMLRGDLSDKIKRELRNEHTKVNEGLKDIRKNVGAHYVKGRQRIRRDTVDPSPIRKQEAMESARRHRQKYDLLLKKYTDLQKDYNLLKNNKENRYGSTRKLVTNISATPTRLQSHTSSSNNIGNAIKSHTTQYLHPSRSSSKLIPRGTRLSNSSKKSIGTKVIHAKPRISNSSNLSGANVIYPSNGITYTDNNGRVIH